MTEPSSVVPQENRDAAIRDSVNHIVSKLATMPGALLPILHEIQNTHGYIPDGSVEIIAEGLNLSRAEVHGVISFYHHFRTKAPGKYVVEVCCAESCQAMGSRALEAHAKSKLGIDFHQTTPDQQITLEPVYCLGNCACSPAMRIGKQVFGRVDTERFDEVVDELYTEAVSLS